MLAERRAQFRVPNVPRSRISERAPFRIYEHAQCRVFERTSLQRVYVIPCWQQMGSSAVLRARRSALVLAASTGVSHPYLHYGDRGRLQKISPPSVLFESSQKMMDQNFEIWILWFLRLFWNLQKGVAFLKVSKKSQKSQNSVCPFAADLDHYGCGQTRSQ